MFSLQLTEIGFQIGTLANKPVFREEALIDNIETKIFELFFNEKSALFTEKMN